MLVGLVAVDSLPEVIGGGLLCRLAAGRVVVEHHLDGVALAAAHRGGVEAGVHQFAVVHLRSARIVASKLPSVRPCSLRSWRIRRVSSSGRKGVLQVGSRLNTKPVSAMLVPQSAARASISARCCRRRSWWPRRG